MSAVATLMRPCGQCGELLPFGVRHDHRNRGPRPTDRSVWKRRSRADRARHVAIHGAVCPGWRRTPHQVAVSDLTSDHLLPLALGGDVLGATRVLCRSCNSARRDREVE